MFCTECGESIADGSEFCWKCGAKQPVAATPEPAPTEADKKKKRGRAGFLRSPAGISLVVMLALVVVAGIALGVVLIFLGGEDAYIDAEIMEVWGGFQSIVDFDSASFATIDLSPAAVAKAQEDLKKIQADVLELEQALAAFAPTNETSEETYNLLAAILGYYDNYTDKTAELYNIIATGQLLDPQVITSLNTLFEETQAFASKAEASADSFQMYIESVYDSD